MTNLASDGRYTVLIPARLASTRLPNKPLADIAGVPMVVRVAQRVQSGISPESSVIVAADSIEILRACEAFDVRAILTRPDHASGSDRLAEASTILKLGDDEIIVNVQGDEPLIEPALVRSVADLLEKNGAASMGTAAHVISSATDFNNPNVVKVVTDASGMALYFSRAPIPWWRDGQDTSGVCLPTPAPLRHIGIYAYRAGFLRTFPTLPPAPIEMTEALEQLRAMWHGYRIAVYVSPTEPGPGVDTPADLERVREHFAGKT